MPVTTIIRSVTYSGNGSTSTPYTVTFPYDAAADVKLLIDGVASTAFTLSGDELRTDEAVDSGSSLVIYRDTPLTQEQTFPSNTTPAAENVRAAVDKLTLIAQERNEEIGRSIKPPIGSSFANNTTLGVDASGNPVARTAEEESTHLGIGASVTAAAASAAAAQASAITAEEQSSLANLEAVAAAASAVIAQAAENGLSYTGPLSLSSSEKTQLAENWPEAVSPTPINVLVIGQSNIANGRPGGTIVFNPEVKIWTVSENPNATVDEFQPWDLSLDPPQHSNPAQSGISPAPVPDPDYQKWSHVLANKLQRLTRRPIHIVQAAESGRSIDPWLTVANGGTAGWWDWIVQETADAGITKYDFLFFDHGESGVLAAITYEEAMRRLRGQLEDAGFIDDSTVFLSREVTSGLVNSQAAALVFITERNGNGNMIDRDLLTIYPDGGLHIDGESHELVGQYHFDWLLARAQTNEVLNFGTATPSTQIQGQIIVLTDGGFKKIPAIEFTANPYPATPDLVFYGEDYVATSGELAGGILTLASGATEPTVNVEQAALTFPAADSQFETASALLSNTGDWLVGFRMRITESGITRRDIFQQYTPANGERMTFRLVSGVFTFYGNGSGGSLTLPSTELISVDQWVTVLVEKSGDNVNLTVNDTTDTDSVTGLAIQQRAFEISVTGNPLRGDLRKFIVYDRAVTATEKAAVKTWLDSL